MSAVTNIRPVTPALPEIVGYVEAVTADRILGWAWSPPTPERRVGIQLHLGNTLIAETVADLPRPDLAGNGIGDGRHAFEVAIPREAASRAAELRVFARCGDAPPVPIGAPPAADGLSEQMAKVLRGVDMLLNSQRLLHRNLQSALTNRPAENDPLAETVASLAEAQAATAEQLAAVERFVVRLDEHLSKIAGSGIKPVVPGFSAPPAAVWAFAASGVALIVAVAGLVHSFAG